MESSILKQIARFLQEQKKQKRWLVVFLCMAIIVGFGTVTALKMRGQAMTHKEKRVICQLAVHQHADECYDEKKENLICGYADYVVHVHNEDCYDWNGNLTCQLPEVEKHEHSEECYTEEATLICGLEETAGHQHGAECYTTQQGGLACQIPEHTHAEECYDETGAVVCGLEEHIHEDACYEWTDVLICQLAEGADGHTHTDACYEVKEILSCGKLELHTHTDECYEKINEEEEFSETNRRLVCTVPVLEEHIHTEDAGCLETVEVTANGELVEEGTVEEETAEGETEEEIFTTDLDGESADEEAGVEGEDEDADKTDADKKDMEQKTYDEIKTYEGEGYVVTVSYNEDANIPEEAELIAEQITEENNEEVFSEHAAKFQNMMEDKKTTMDVLFKIGFYVGNEEIEPKSSVQVTIQFLDENGLPEGAPITIVHFGDEENEVLDGTIGEGGSISFEAGSFSYFGAAAKEAANGDATEGEPLEEEGEVFIDEEFKCTSAVTGEKYDITFHVAGKVKLPNSEGTTGREADSQTEAENGSEETDVDIDIIETETVEESQAEAEEEAGIEESESDEEGSMESDDEVSTDEDGNVDVDDEQNTGSAENGNTDWKFSITTEGETSGSLSEEGKFAAIARYVEELGAGRRPFWTQALTYSLAYQGTSVDLSQCTVTARIETTDKLIETAKGAVDLEESKEDTDIKITVTAIEMSEEEEIEERDALVLDEEKTGEMNFRMHENVLALYATSVVNPRFTVQYYAWLDRIKLGDTGDITVIDTSSKANGGKAALPQNGITPKTTKISIDEKSNVVVDKYGKERFGVETNKKLTEVYKERTNQEYIKNPSLYYFDALIENSSYVLEEVWVLKDGKDADSVASEDWEVYSYDDTLHFTNSRMPDQDAERYIQIKDDGVIRLVYTTEKKNCDNPVTLYDYDISNGQHTQDGNATVMHTGKNGINSGLENGSGKTPYAFGNADFSDYGQLLWNGNQLNKANTKGYGNCTFGLVTGIKGNSMNDVAFASGISAPNVFGSSEDHAGKKIYEGRELVFSQNGDTYTLTGLKNGQTTLLSDLDKFWSRESWSKSIMWANSFWAVDDITEGADIQFGGEKSKQKYEITGKSGLLNPSDELPDGVEDGKYNHNCFFGMYTEVGFELDEAYTGPLEYLFFGDDDMWVFLCDVDENGNTTNPRLVCDIGGVHSSIGEYVDLADYLRNSDGTNKKGKYALKFFYTERGASGSSCWMQFTLPTVTIHTPDQITGQARNSLKVGKVVEGSDIDPNEEYWFRINFQNADKTGNLPDDYAYTKYKKVQVMDDNGQPKVDEDGNPVYKDEKQESNILIRDGGVFTLSHNEYIVVEYLPVGASYTIEEVKKKDENYVIIINGGEAGSGTVDGSIEGQDITVENVVNYVNDYSYELPETGGSGSIKYTMAGVLAILLGAGFMYRKKVRERRV